MLEESLKFAEELNFEQVNSSSFTVIKALVADVQKNFSYSCSNLNQLDKIIHVLRLDKRKNVQALGDKLNKFKLDTIKEIERVKGMYAFDNSFGSFTFIAGVDEVGRGPLAGPIVSASVVLDYGCEDVYKLILGIKDSKKLTPKMREKLSEEIKEKAVSYSIALLDNNEIDTKGIGFCNNEVFKLACSGLKVTPDLVLSDGYPIKDFNIENEFIIKGDEKSAAIACASIIAKVYRDKLMEDYAKQYPAYGFDRNAGYGTGDHINAIKEQGPCAIHRRSFIKNFI